MIEEPDTVILGAGGNKSILVRNNETRAVDL
jgi:hypothetical protein